MTANAVAKIGTTRQTTRKITSYSGEEKQIRRAEGKARGKATNWDGKTGKNRKNGETGKRGRNCKEARKQNGKEDYFFRR